MLMHIPIPLVFFLFVASNVMSQVFFKIGLRNVNDISKINFFGGDFIYIYFGILGQVMGLLIWLCLLKMVNLYWAGMMAALIPVSIALTGIFVFGERINTTGIIGMVIVVVGLVIMYLDTGATSVS